MVPEFAYSINLCLTSIKQEDNPPSKKYVRPADVDNSESPI